MSFGQFLLDNYVVLFELVGLLIMLFISAHITALMKKYTRIAIVLLFMVSLVSFFEGWTQTFDKLSMWRPFLTATKYTLYPLVLVSIMLVFSSINGKTSLKWKLIEIVPIVLCMPLYYTSQWSHLIFYFTETNNYCGGPLKFFPYVVFCIYTAIFVIQNIIYLKHYSIREKIIMLYIIIGALLCVVLYTIYDLSDNYSLMLTTAIVFYFLFIYIHIANVDPLTRLLSRQSYYQDIEIIGDKVDAVVSIDMNELKYFNDSFGHDRGDIALSTVANVFKEYALSKHIYRVGGDEFVIFYTNINEEELVKNIELMKEKLSEVSYSCAFGYSMKLDNIENMIREADLNMFKDKALTKEKILKSGGEVHNRK